MKVGVGVCLSLVLALAASCGDDEPTVMIGGSVGNLEGTGLILRNSAGDELPIASNGDFQFPEPVAIGDSFSVTVAAQPTSPKQTCSVTNGDGRVDAPQNITNIFVLCDTDEFSIGGTVIGLTGTGLVLQNNGADDIAVSVDGTFTFPTLVGKGMPFAVTVKTQPTGPSQTCTVSGGTGTVGDGKVTTVVVNCAVDRFTVGGAVAGLVGTAVLQNNGGDDITISANGTFAFPMTVASGATYNVTILAQPAVPSQTCVVSSGSGTVTTGNITSVRVDCTTNTFRIGGTVTGLAGSGLVLRDNGGDNLAISANGTFTFSQRVASGAAFAVTVLTQPSNPSQVCTVSGGSGTVGSADVTDVQVTCVTSSFTIGGTVSGLAGSGLVLRQNGGDDLVISSNGSFAFATPVNSGASYAVTIAAQPVNPSQTCTVSSGAGTVGAGAVTSVAVSCTTNTFTIGGTISGLAGTVVLRNNGGNDLTLIANGSFTFSTRVASGLTYAVTVQTQPGTPSQTCTVNEGTGIVMSENVNSVSVVCVTNQFSVGGSVSGLAGNGLVLRNGGDNIEVFGNGTFAFPTTVASGATYAVTVVAQPSGPEQTCTVANGSGTIGAANVANVTVTCTTDTFRVGGLITGLINSGLVLQNNGGDPLTISTTGAFSFAGRIASGQIYNVTVSSQPADQTCTVTDGLGLVIDADITSVRVSCTTNP